MSLTQAVEEVEPGLLSQPDRVALCQSLAVSGLVGLHLATRHLVSRDLRVVGRGMPRHVERAHSGSDLQLGRGENHWKGGRKRGFVTFDLCKETHRRAST